MCVGPFNPQAQKIMAAIIILPLNERHNRVNLGKQSLKPSSDRCNVVELWRVRLDRAFEDLTRSSPMTAVRAGDGALTLDRPRR